MKEEAKEMTKKGITLIIIIDGSKWTLLSHEITANKIHHLKAI